MVKQAEILAVVPARGGSKSLPRKNIRRFVGHPLLSYSIAAGVQSSHVGRVIVSTDDEEIAEVSRAYGAEVPFLRPSELAMDDTPDLPVFEHALTWLEENEQYQPKIVVQLRPTSPLRPHDCVDRAIELLSARTEADSVRGVVLSGQNPYKMWKFSSEGWMVPIVEEKFDEAFNMPRQQLPTTYWQTGHIDAVRVETIKEKGSMTGKNILPLVLDAAYSIDIDTAQDWHRAESVVQAGELDFVRPGRVPRLLPEKVDLVILDFDGVMTDDRVWIDEVGREAVAANRRDGWGIARLKDRGVDIQVLSSEANPVVVARCQKLGLPVIQDVKDKASTLQDLLSKRKIDPSKVIYLGNDVNDVPCFPIVGFAVVVQDAHPTALAEADLRLENRGGHGAVRELCDLILERLSND